MGVSDRAHSTPAIGADGTVYVGSENDRLYAVNPDGTLKWAFPTGADVYSPAIGADGTIYIGSQSDYLYAINPITARRSGPLESVTCPPPSVHAL